MARVRAVAAPASLKGVVSALEAAQLLADGLRKTGIDAKEVPVADGGEGTAEVLAAALGGQWHTARVSDPLGRPVTARWLLLPDETAVVESAEAIGLWRLRPDELNPLGATSAGLGELMLAASAHKPRLLLICLGGTATVDGGAGLRATLENRLPAATRVAYDVENPLLGERGAARVFGPQKGASLQDVDELERRLASSGELRPYASVRGAGAAGGLGAALAALGAELVPGSELVLELIGFRGKARGSALVVTGEGTVDESSAEGKATGAVARLCREEQLRCVVFGGTILAPLQGVEHAPLGGTPATAREDLRRLGERLGAALPT